MARILVIDDEKQQLFLRAAILEAHGYQVVTAETGSEAIERFTGERFDLVITDWLMPNITGIDLSRQLKSIQPDLPIIMLTGWGNLLTNAGRQTEAIDYLLSKPCDVAELMAAVAAVLKLADRNQPEAAGNF